MRKAVSVMVLLVPVFAMTPVAAKDVTVTLKRATDKGVAGEIGTITFRDTPHGLLVTPNLRELKPGPHGTHLHENPSCDPTPADNDHSAHHGHGGHGGHDTAPAVPAGAAGGHYDPKKTGAHEGPYGNGHLGDLPNIYVEADGTARIPVLAPRVKVADLKGRAVMIHHGADRYDRHAEHHSHGQGGARMYCGVVP